MDKLQILLISASAFEHVARQINSEGMNLEIHSVTIASGVNAALALEYYAKCLVFAHCGKYKKIHNLEVILSDIPQNLRDQLRKEYEKALTDEEIIRAKMTSERTRIPIEPDFNSVTRNWSRVFVDGRYWFETTDETVKTVHWFFFDPLVIAFQRVIGHISRIEVNE